ncbi:MAG: rod shape-determining protein MreC [Lachnospiraceae bacterium]|nr:rod shape-determining protein MreC [Lachnospiraceae bacterium]
MFRIRNHNKKNRLSSKHFLLIMTLGCVGIFLLSLTFNISGGPLNAVAGYVFVPMQNGINNAGSWLSRKVNDFRTLSEVLEENEQLKQQVADLTVDNTSLKLEKYELENYRKLLELDEKYPAYEKVAASVIAMDSVNWFDSFTINRGSKDGIEVGMNVIAGGGLVGIVTDVGPNYAKVRSIIDDTSKVSAMVTSTQTNFIVSGNLQTVNSDGVITFSGLKDKDNQVSIGDQVVTSYVSDQYQQGILIGYITTMEEESNNLTKSGTITPIVDFEHIQEVFVILNKKEFGEENVPVVEDTQTTEVDTQ